MLLSFDVLDVVLKYIGKSSGHSPSDLQIIIPQLYPTLGRRDVRVIIDKLYKDGNIDFVTPNKGGVLDSKGINTENWVKDYPYYYITFEGIMLLQEDGYTTAYTQSKYQKRYEKARDFFLICGSCMAGIGTLLLFFAEVVRHFHWIASIEMATFLLVLLAATLIAAALLLLIQSLMKSKEKPTTK